MENWPYLVFGVLSGIAVWYGVAYFIASRIKVIQNNAAIKARQQCLQIALDAAWSNKGTAMLGPELNCMKIAKSIEAVLEDSDDA